jgi:hypothetical protein
MNKKIILTIAASLLVLPVLFAKKEELPVESPGSGGGGSTLANYVDANGNYNGPTADYAGGQLTDWQLQSAFNSVKNSNSYTTKYMNDLERAYRVESAHFKSGQFSAGYSPGMVATSASFPFGWSSLQNYASQKGISSSQFSRSNPFTVGGQQYYYVNFPDFQTALDFFGWFVKNVRNGDVLQWGFGTATNSPEAIYYRQLMNAMKLRYTI